MTALRIKKIFFTSDAIKFFFIILALFLLIFPKGGVKVGSVPITWGYILLAFVALFSIFRKNFKVRINHLILLAFLIPFQLVCLLHFFINGVSNLGFTISFVINFYILPIFFFLTFSEYIKKIPLDLLLTVIRRGIYFLACYGIFLFFFKIITGNFFGIPLLTTNLSDSLSMENKYIARGGIFKLISTYNNGNIFGICMLMILPIYQYAEHKTYKRLIVKLALLLTLSRTVWIGIIIHEISDTIMFSEKGVIKKIKLLVFLLTFSVITVFIIKKTSLDWSFFLDLSLGNRIQQFEALKTTGLLSDAPFESIREIVYMSMLENFGYIGLFSFCVAIFSPFIIRLRNARFSKLNTMIALGLMNYLIICMSDGAILFIPTLAIFWFLTALML